MGSQVFSMTGFGRGHAEDSRVSIQAEIRSVNSRFLDLIIKTPRSYSGLEGTIRELVTARIERGRVEVFVSRTVLAVDAGAVQWNSALFLALFEKYQEVAKELGVDNDSARWEAARDILARRDVLEVTENGEVAEGEKELLSFALGSALDQLTEMRCKEGLELSADVAERVAVLGKIQKQISKKVVASADRIRERILERVSKLEPEVHLDESRLTTEVALIADRADVSEELVRLASHLEQCEQTLKQTGSRGRRLEFLIQELGRELNTIGSKAQDADVQILVVDGKSEIERMREQVQNIE